jgi:hypothetical protein
VTPTVNPSVALLVLGEGNEVETQMAATPDPVDIRVPDLGPTPEHGTPWRRTASRTTRRLRMTRRLLALVVAAGLGVDSYVHWHLAPGFDGVEGTASPQISQGELFRLETALALVATLLVLLTRHRFAATVAFLIAAGGLGAVLLYGYVDVGGWGPLPDMYDPIWYPEKTVSAVAEAVAALGALWLLVLPPVAPTLTVER